MKDDIESSTPSLDFAQTGQLQPSAIESLFVELDHDHVGYVSRDTITKTLLEVYHQLTPFPKPYHLVHPSRVDDLDVFIQSLFPGGNAGKEYNWEEFRVLVHGWRLPPVDDSSFNPHSTQHTKATERKRKRFIDLQTLRTKWSINHHRYIFLSLVICLQISFGLWQFFTFFNDVSARDAFGTGMLVAKFCAGLLYPTLCLMVLSMSRTCASLVRRSKYLRSFVDWEYARNFHIKMACLAYFFGIFHGISHLTGTYKHALAHPEALAIEIWKKPGTPVPATYMDFMKWRASWTGVLCLTIFFIMSLCGSPMIRKRFFEIFQLSHLLMYPLFGLLLLHGSSAILRAPMLGWWLLVPIALVLTEKLHRIVRAFIPVQTSVIQAEADLVALKIHVGRDATYKYRAGQHIYLQIASLGRFQWHPFTVSTIAEDHITLHIRSSAGDWTRSLYNLASKTSEFKCAIDGPYGSPSREFYRYDKTIILAAGVGITPFSAILCDLYDKLQENQSPWKKDIKSVKQSMKQDKQVVGAQGMELSPFYGVPELVTPERVFSIDTMRTLVSSSRDCSYPNSLIQERKGSVASTCPSTKDAEEERLSHLKTILNKRSVSLHWTVRTCEDLQWLSSLLNKFTPDLHVYVNVKLYVTQTNKTAKPSLLIFRSLLDHRRIGAIQPTSFLTGLLPTCHFSRPNFEEILNKFHTAHSIVDVQESRFKETPSNKKNKKLGIIFCGPVAISRVLSRQCENMTSRARADGSRLRYHYHAESF
ncbi:hypothetical protein CBS101457_000515 [Exobasidium rhododendri]|nr:hypothetical protein CBS101457_000515 [Exobasidium rhododendri]